MNRATYLGEPTTDIIPPDTNDIPPLQTPSSRVISRTISEQLTVSEAKILDERRVSDLDRRGGVEFCMRNVGFVGISEDETFVAFTNDEGIATPISPSEHRDKFTDLYSENEA